MFLESINPSLISKQGTAIGAAINLAARSFTPQEGVGRAIVVITDGENHEGGAVEAAKAAAEKGIQVSVLGVGLPTVLRFLLKVQMIIAVIEMEM